LRKRPEFVKVQDTGSKVNSDCFLALYLPNSLDRTRLGLTVSSKVGPAVLRNRVRRRLRELFRAHSSGLPKGIDLVLIARPSAAQADFEQLSKSFFKVSAELKRRLP
jgi:ribonuclease P protein component